MKTLELKTHQYILLIKAFREWLTTLNYSQSAITNFPNYVRELLHYLESKNILSLRELNQELLNHYLKQLKHRKNRTREGALSNYSINHMITGINLFLNYLNLTGKLQLDAELKRLPIQRQLKTVLTKEEVIGLFQSLESINSPTSIRNKAILSCLYGAGLRINELYHLNIDDISISRKQIIVTHGKKNKQRIVPLLDYFLQNIQYYIQHLRDTYVDIAKHSEDALFIDVSGERIKKDTYYIILHQIITNANIDSLEDKTVTPHTFRHTIATHLLQGNTPIEQIAKFLGHHSLESTMIYTHLAEELNHQEP